MKKLIGTFIFAISTLSVANAAPTLALSQSSIDWNEQTFITLTASALTDTNIQFALYADLDSNGIIDGSDPLVWRHRMTDNNTNSVLDVFSLKDRNPAIGTVEINVSYHGLSLPDLQVSGDYIWELTQQDLLTTQALFAVTPPSSEFVIEGSVEDMVTGSAPLGATFVFLESFMPSDGPGPACWVKPDGTFSICLPTDSISPTNLMGIGAVSLGYLSADSEEGDPEEYSFHSFSNILSSGTNTLANSLKVFSPVYLPAEDINLVTISGKVEVVQGGDTNELAGAWLQLEGDEAGVFGFDITDSNGCYSLVIPAEADLFTEIIVSGYGLNLREIVGQLKEVNGVTNDVTLNFLCSEAEYIVSGVLSNGIPGIDVELEEYNTGAISIGSCISNGQYEVCVTPGTNWFAYIGGDSSLQHDLVEASFSVEITNQSIFEQSGMLDSGALITGTVYDNFSNPLFGGEVYVPAGWDWMAGMEVNFSGQYELRVPEGTNSLNAGWFSGFIDESIQDLVLLNGSVTNIDFYLDPAAIISGWITTEGTNAYTECWIQVLEDPGSNNWNYIAGADVMMDGSYTIYVPPGSNYVVAVWPYDGETYLPQYYSNAASFSEAIQIQASLATGATNINFDLEQGAVFTGTIMGNGFPRNEMYVTAYTNNGLFWEQAVEPRYVDNGTGMFSLAVPAGNSYVIHAGSDQWGQYWVSEFYNGVLRPEDAQTFSVSAGQAITGLYFDLEEGFRFNGYVQQQDSGGIENCRISMLDSISGEEVVYSYTDEVGNFDFTVPAHSDLIVFADHPLYAGEYLRETYSTNNAEIINYGYYINIYESFSLHSLISDRDGDGIPDYQEDLVPDGEYRAEDELTDWDNADTDWDGQGDYTEIVAGTSPTNSGDVFEIGNGSTSSNGYFVLNWDAKPGRTYTLDFSTNLVDGFNALASGLTSGSYTDTVHTAEQQVYYKLKVQN
ncbi:MAG TPA: hypothetical protein VIR63_06450 [Pontiella sp.]